MGNIILKFKNAWLPAMACLLALTACGSDRPLASDMPPPDPLAGALGHPEYQIGPGDLLTVKVFQMLDLERQVRVDNQGRISLPLIGTVQAAGKPLNELEQEVAARYAERYLQNPQVSIFVDEFTGRRVTLGGAVTEPGIYPIAGPNMTLQQAVATAKGVTSVASRSNIMIFRTIDGQKMIARFDLNKIEEGEMPDPPVYGGDIVVIYRSDARLLLRTALELTPFLMVWRAYR